VRAWQRGAHPGRNTGGAGVLFKGVACRTVTFTAARLSAAEPVGLRTIMQQYASLISTTVHSTRHTAVAGL